MTYAPQPLATNTPDKTITQPKDLIWQVLIGYFRAKQVYFTKITDTDEQLDPQKTQAKLNSQHSFFEKLAIEFSCDGKSLDNYVAHEH